MIRLDKRGWSVNIFSLFLLVSVFSCKQASDLKAFTEANYALHSVRDARVNGIDLTDKYSPKDFTTAQGDSLLASVYTNNLRFSATLNLLVQMKDPEVARTMTITKLKWLLLVDGNEALTGEVNEQLHLTDGLNTLPVSTTVIMAEKDGLPNYEGLSKLVTLLGKRQDLRQHLTFRIKPTVNTPLGNVEVPNYITVAQPPAAITGILRSSRQ